jgi:hypothetical protein
LVDGSNVVHPPPTGSSPTTSFMNTAPDPPHITIRFSVPTHVIAVHPRHAGAPGVFDVDNCVHVAV